MGARSRALASARARFVAAPIANREPQKSTGGGRQCAQLFSVEREGGGGGPRRPRGGDVVHPVIRSRRARLIVSFGSRAVKGALSPIGRPFRCGRLWVIAVMADARPLFHRERTSIRHLAM